DELGHKPLCDVCRHRVERETDLRARCLEVPLRGARIAPQHPSVLRERLLENVAQDEHTELGAAQGVATDKVAQASAEKATRRHGVADRDGALSVELPD